MDDTVIKKAIAEKKLKGEIIKEDTPSIDANVEVEQDDTSVITASSEEIVGYLESHAQECYPNKTDYTLTFKRHKP